MSGGGGGGGGGSGACGTTGRRGRKENRELKEVSGHGVLVIILSITRLKIQHVTKSSVKKDAYAANELRGQHDTPLSSCLFLGGRLHGFSFLATAGEKINNRLDGTPGGSQ